MMITEKNVFLLLLVQMTKNDENSKTFWNPTKSKNLRFWRPTWRQVGFKIEAEIDVIFERRFFEKNSFFLRKIHFFDIHGVQVGSKKRSKIDQNLKSKMGCLLASIFDAFWSFFGGKLGEKIEPRCLKIRYKNVSIRL